MEEVVTATGGDSGTSVATQDDSYGYRWMVLRNPEGAPSVEDLAVGINAVSGSIETAGYGDRLLCAVFAFTRRPRAAPIYFIYNYKRGYWYPFVPGAGRRQQRSTERELQIKAQMAANCRSSRNSSAGSPCGESRSERGSPRGTCRRVAPAAPVAPDRRSPGGCRALPSSLQTVYGNCNTPASGEHTTRPRRR